MCILALDMIIRLPPLFWMPVMCYKTGGAINMAGLHE